MSFQLWDKGKPLKAASVHISDEDSTSETENLLGESGGAVSVPQQCASVSVRIYRADGLPQMDAGIMAQVKKRCLVDVCHLGDPYVQVFFAGLKGFTTKCKRTLSPVWNEQVAFTCPFPLPTEPLVLQVKDDVCAVGGVVGTTLVHLDKISNPKDDGFLPTFGPCFVYLHDTRSKEEADPSYKGRLLMAIVTETSSESNVTKNVKMESIPALTEGSYGFEDEFLLFACIQEASMIDRKVGERGDIRFTLQMGEIGRDAREIGEESNFATPSIRPVAINKFRSRNERCLLGDEIQAIHFTCGIGTIEVNLLNFIAKQGSLLLLHPREYMQAPFAENMPCVWLKGKWPDNRKRMFASNILHKMAKKLKDSLKIIQKPENTIDNKSDNKKSLENLEKEAKAYLKVLKECFDYYAARTQLDSERLKICESDIEDIVKMSVTARNAQHKTMLESALAKLRRLKHKMKMLAEDPQCMLPDVVMWMECGGRRLGYTRIPAKSLLFTVTPHERGVHSATTADFFLKPLGKKDKDAILTRMRCYFWLGVTKNMSRCFENLPKGYTMSYATVQEENDDEAVPRTLHYVEKHYLQLRAHLHQARSLPCLQLTRYLECFARVFIGNRSQSTQVKHGTVNPIWDETLHFRGIVVHGDIQRAVESPPSVVVEIIDGNASRKSKLLGRVVVDSIKMNGHPPTLQWFDVQLHQNETDGQLLAAFELSIDDEYASDAEDDSDDDWGAVMSIPPEIGPRFSMHRIEVLFWGLREMKRVHLRNLSRPRVYVECAGQVVQSNVMVDYKRHSNFVAMVTHLDMDLPDEEDYLPSLVLKLMDTRSFGRQSVVATHVVHSLQKYAFNPRADSRRSLSTVHFAGSGDAGLVDSRPSFVRSNDIVLNIDDTAVEMPANALHQIFVVFPWTNYPRRSVVDNAAEDDEEEEELDWWSRYYIATNQWRAEVQKENVLAGVNSLPTAAASQSYAPVAQPAPRSSLLRTSLVGLEKFRDTAWSINAMKARAEEEAQSRDAIAFVVYPCELESVPEFSGFQEWLHSFELTRGRRFTRNAKREKVVAIFKGCFRIYRTPLPPMAADDLLPTPDGREGLFGGVPENTPTRVLVRAYMIKAVNLTATYVTNTADPYIVLKLGRQRLSDKRNYISKQLNPFFGKCFEFVATFPSDAILHVQLFDWDLMGSDDLIGETIVDLENRIHSRHRPSCGIARVYETSGPNAWRDVLKPTEILAKLCKDNRLDGPYINQTTIRIGKDIYDFKDGFGDGAVGVENRALSLLHRWSEISPGKYPLTPEHVETRTLYHPKKPGESQGQLLMWLDMFEENTVPPTEPRDISVRKPESYELRVIIWNTDEVMLADAAFFTGEKMSDIYVRGLLTGKEDAQETDVHYRSLTGEGNFNWRFVFPFDYLRVERKVVVSRKVSVFSWDETEFKLPAHLLLEAWDADHFKPDDCLGYLTLDLNRFPRGAKTAKYCTLDMVRQEANVPHVSLFKQRRIKGWWPFSQPNAAGQMQLTGKVEAEIELLTKEEAEKSPVGLARQEPEALSMPKRPETSFINFLHPLKSLRYAFWRNYKGKILKFVLIIALLLFVLLFLYSAPGYAAKRLLGA